eukprot:UN04887
MNSELISIRRAISETVTCTGQYYHEMFGHFIYEGIKHHKGTHDDDHDVMSFADTVSTSVGVTTKENDNHQTDQTHQSHQSECGLMDAHTINQYWKNHVNVELESRDDRSI